MRLRSQVCVAKPAAGLCLRSLQLQQLCSGLAASWQQIRAVAYAGSQRLLQAAVSCANCYLCRFAAASLTHAHLGVPCSEPEVAIMRDLATGFRPHVWMNAHSGMEALFMPYDHRAEVPAGPEAKAALELLQQLNKIACGGRCAVGSGGKSVGAPWPGPNHILDLALATSLPLALLHRKTPDSSRPWHRASMLVRLGTSGSVQHSALTFQACFQPPIASSEGVDVPCRLPGAWHSH